VSLSLAEVAARTGRSRSSCKNKAQHHGIDRSFRGRFDGEWSVAELQVLHDSALTYGQVAEAIGRSLSAVEHMSLRQGIDRSSRSGVGLKKGDDNPYTEAELAVVRNTGLSLRQVAAQLGRSHVGVTRKASELGIKRRVPWLAWEDALLEDTSFTLVEVASRIGRKLGTVEARASLHDIVRGPLSGPRHHRWVDGRYAPTYRGSDWLKVRGAALERDGYTCQDCGFTDFTAQKLHVHHMIPFRFRPVNDLRWLVTLCEPCHYTRPEHAWEELPAAVAAQLAADSRGGERIGEALPPA
jgi:hypothetical protein